LQTIIEAALDDGIVEIFYEMLVDKHEKIADNLLRGSADDMIWEAVLEAHGRMKAEWNNAAASAETESETEAGTGTETETETEAETEAGTETETETEAETETETDRGRGRGGD